MSFNLKDLDNRKTFISHLLKGLMLDIFAIATTAYFMIYGKHSIFIYGIFIATFICIAFFLIMVISHYTQTIKTNIQIEREIELKKFDIECRKIELELEKIKRKE